MSTLYRPGKPGMNLSCGLAGGGGEYGSKGWESAAWRNSLMEGVTGGFLGGLSGCACRGRAGRRGGGRAASGRERSNCMLPLLRQMP